MSMFNLDEFQGKLAQIAETHTAHQGAVKCRKEILGATEAIRQVSPNNTSVRRARAGLLQDVKDKKVCNPTVDALYRFFSQNLEIECECEETKCMNVGDKLCEFQVSLQTLQVFKIALDDIDTAIISDLRDKTMDDYRTFIKQLGEKLELVVEEVEFRIQTLQNYQIIDNNFNLTPVGNTFFSFIETNPLEEAEAFDPPWKEMSKLTSTIAATRSFAEAFVVVAEEEELPWMVDDKEIIDLKERAKDKKSFAKLLSEELQEKESED